MKANFPHWPSRPLEILVLDDDYRWRDLVALHVEMQLGIPPVLASHGQQALNIMEERPIDIVISDLVMPEMDGFEFLQRARNLYPRTKVILLSVDFGAFPVPRPQLIERGALAAISKAEISSTLGSLLRILQETTRAERLTV